MYSFPTTVIIHYRKLGCLKQFTFVVRQFGGYKSETEVSASLAPSEGYQGGSSLFLSVAGGARDFSACGSITPISVPVFTWPCSLCSLVFSLLLIRTPVVACRVHPKCRMI